MAPDTGLHSIIDASTASGSLPTIPTSPRTLRDMTLEDELVDPEAKLILSDFTQVTEYFPMDLYRSMFFISTLDREYDRALDEFDTLAKKLYDTSLSGDTVAKIKLEMSRSLNLMMLNRSETLAEASRLYETADQAFNKLDNIITVSEENLQRPPSENYFLPSPPPEPTENTDLSDEQSENLEDVEDEALSVKTDELTPSHLHESELKALRRRMKKSFQWMPTQSCIKKELQTNGRWPLRIIDKAARRKHKLAKIKRKRQREMKRLKQERELAARRSAQSQAEQKKNPKERQKKDAKVQYTMPVAADEPTYCYCEDVSYGEMIACENEDCPREWFHLECAELTVAPRGKWYCKDCKPKGSTIGSGRKRRRA